MKSEERHAEIKVLIVTSDKSFSDRVKSLISKRGDGRYSCFVEDKSELDLPDADVALVDSDVLSGQPARHMASFKLLLGEVPFIYICESLDNSEDLTAVKSFAADYLIKATLSGKMLHNCIKWAVDTHRLKLELEQQNKRYQSLFYNAVDPAFFLNPDGTVSQVNDAFVEAFGTETTELFGRSFGHVFHDADDFKRIKSKLTDGGENHVDCEVQFKYLDRNARFLGHLKISALREYGFGGKESEESVTRFHGSLSNISFRERMRNVKQRADRVDTTYRLARTLAHEIRNPLTNINLALENMVDQAAEDSEFRPMLDIVKRSSGRINDLIDQLLTSSERGKLLVNECDLIGLIKEVIEESSDRTNLSKVEIQTDFDADNLSYPCDMQKIKLAVSNLVCNAIEAIECDKGIVKVGTYTEDGYLFIYVEDNGKGMTDEVKKSLFDPFFTDKHGGVGLGLTATQTIVAEHEGEIEVESAPGYGSTFTISLPLERFNRY